MRLFMKEEGREGSLHAVRNYVQRKAPTGRRMGQSLIHDLYIFRVWHRILPPPPLGQETWVTSGHSQNQLFAGFLEMRYPPPSHTCPTHPKYLVKLHDDLKWLPFQWCFSQDGKIFNLQFLLLFFPEVLGVEPRVTYNWPVSLLVNGCTQPQLPFHFCGFFCLDYSAPPCLQLFLSFSGFFLFLSFSFSPSSFLSLSFLLFVHLF